MKKIKETLEEIFYGVRPLDEISKTTGFYGSDIIYLSQRSPHIRLKNIIQKARRSGANIKFTTSLEIDQLSLGKKHQGVLLVRSEKISYPNIKIEEIISQPSGLYVLIERLNDPQNLGSIVRSMAAFGAEALVMNKKKTPPLGQVVWKVSAGALSQLPVLWANGCQNFITKLKEKSKNQIKSCFIGASLSGEPMCVNRLKEIHQEHKKIFLVLGDEERGISRGLLNELDFLLRIPHSPKINSLNVGVATGILLHSLSLPQNYASKL